MLQLNKDQQRRPIGGHQYPENGLLVRGESFNEVKQKLTEYRINNHIPVGDPEQDILLHYAKNWPWMVKSDPNATPKQVSGQYTLYRQWIDETWRDPPAKMISVKEATDRWETCRGCPFNRSKTWFKTPESAELARRAFLLRKGADVPEDIGICSLHFFADLSVLSFVENAAHFVDVKKDSTKPEKCWVK